MEPKCYGMSDSITASEESQSLCADIDRQSIKIDTTLESLLAIDEYHANKILITKTSEKSKLSVFEETESEGELRKYVATMSTVESSDKFSFSLDFQSIESNTTLRSLLNTECQENKILIAKTSELMEKISEKSKFSVFEETESDGKLREHVGKIFLVNNADENSKKKIVSGKKHCSCKTGACVNYKCGCNKRGVFCSSSCKCREKCQNQVMINKNIQNNIVIAVLIMMAMIMKNLDKSESPNTTMNCDEKICIDGSYGSLSKRDIAEE